MPSIFSQIIEGKIPCHKVAENELYFAFMELSPMKEGHVLVIPKQETDYLFDLDDTTLSGLILFSKTIATAIKKAVHCEKVALLVYGLMVRHAHVHLVPVDGTPGELDFGKAPKASPEALEQAATKIRQYL